MPKYITPIGPAVAVYEDFSQQTADSTGLQSTGIRNCVESKPALPLISVSAKRLHDCCLAFVLFDDSQWCLPHSIGMLLLHPSCCAGLCDASYGGIGCASYGSLT